MDNSRLATIEVPKDVRTIFCSLGVKHLKGKDDYIRVFQNVLLEIALDREFNLTDLRVFMVVLGQMEYQNHFSLTQAEIGKFLDVAPPNVSRSLQKLEKKELIMTIGHTGRKKIYSINPKLAFKSKAKELVDLEEEWFQLQIEQSKTA